MSLTGIEKLSARHFRELEDETPAGRDVPTLDDYTAALAIIHAQEAAAVSAVERQLAKDDALAVSLREHRTMTVAEAERMLAEDMRQTPPASNGGFVSLKIDGVEQISRRRSMTGTGTCGGDIGYFRGQSATGDTF